MALSISSCVKHPLLHNYEKLVKRITLISCYRHPLVALLVSRQKERASRSHKPEFPHSLHNLNLLGLQRYLLRCLKKRHIIILLRLDLHIINFILLNHQTSAQNLTSAIHFISQSHISTKRTTPGC